MASSTPSLTNPNPKREGANQARHLTVNEPTEHANDAIYVHDEDDNDIATFFHSEHATVGQSYETALRLATLLVEANNGAIASARPSPRYPVRAALEGLVKSLDDLIADSEGVAGLHRNGDVATWDELTSGGRFEDWLSSLDAARVALSVSTPTGEGEDGLTRLLQIAQAAISQAVSAEHTSYRRESLERIESDIHVHLQARGIKIDHAALSKPLGGEAKGYVTWQQASLEQLARIKALIPASLSYEVPDPVEAIASTFREYVKVAGEATALRKQIAALRDALGEPFMTGNSGCEGGPFVKLKYETLAETQRAHTAFCEFFRPTAPTSPSKSSGEEASPCHWGGGNDIIWCSTCGAEYAYAKGKQRPECPRRMHTPYRGAGDLDAGAPNYLDATKRGFTP